MNNSLTKLVSHLNWSINLENKPWTITYEQWVYKELSYVFYNLIIQSTLYNEQWTYTDLSDITHCLIVQLKKEN